MIFIGGINTAQKALDFIQTIICKKMRSLRQHFCIYDIYLFYILFHSHI